MIDTAQIALSRGAVHAVVLPTEGGVLARLSVGGRSVLATTPWARDQTPGWAPAETEAEWVERWLGGWQLCFPSAGQVDPGSPWPQGFHGVASQAPWSVAQVTDSEVTIRWSDDHSLSAERTWRLTDSGAQVHTVVRNDSGKPRPLVIAEHLVLGGDVLSPVIDAAAELTLAAPPGARLAPLDYSGRPQAGAVAWPGPATDRWERVDRDTPARVAALVDVEPRVLRIDGPHVIATVSWSGLPHALLWEELAASPDAPWNSSVVALGIEPTSAPHGLGTALPSGAITLAAGSSLSWAVELAVEWTGDPLDNVADSRREQL